MPRRGPCNSAPAPAQNHKVKAAVPTGTITTCIRGADWIICWDAAETHPCGRLSAMVSPAQVDTCIEGIEDLLAESADLARRTGRPLNTHAQGYPKFNQMVRGKHIMSIEWLHRIGFLGPQTIIGHAVFTDEHPWHHWPHRRDLH